MSACRLPKVRHIMHVLGNTKCDSAQAGQRAWESAQLQVVLPCRFDAGKFDYGVDNRTLLAIEVFLFAWVELRRYQDMKKPGAVNQDPIFQNNKLPDGNEPGYPGDTSGPRGGVCLLNVSILAYSVLASWHNVETSDKQRIQIAFTLRPIGMQSQGGLTTTCNRFSAHNACRWHF